MPKHTKKKPSRSSPEVAAVYGATGLDTLEVEGCNLERLRKARNECRKVADVLLAKSLQDKVDNDPLFKAQRNIRRCSLQGAFRNLSDTVNYKIGQALCKNRLCPNCQRVLSAKRKYNFLTWFEANKEQTAKYYFYHVVLTMKHRRDLGIRTDVYTEELLQNFKKLRGGCGYRDNHAYWNKRVAGGVYSAETTSAHDKTLHIHLHCLVMAKMPLWRKVRRVDVVETVRGTQKRVYKKKGHKSESDKSEFEKEIQARWLALTGDSTCGVFIEPVYTLDANRNKVYMTKGQAGIESAVAECIKYTMKADADSVSEFSSEHLRGLLQLKKRYSGRFGCLTVKSKASAAFKRLDMLNIDFLDLEIMKREELRQLFNPETGEIMDKVDTRIAVSWFANTKVQVSELELRDRLAGGPRQVVVPVEQALELVDVPGFAPRWVDAYAGPSHFDGAHLVTALSARPAPLIEYARGETPYGGDAYYSFKDLTQVVYYENDEKQAVAKRLAGSMYARYENKNDLN